jgi:hypothetical protein
MKNLSSLILVVILSFFIISCHKSNLQRPVAKENSNSSGKSASNPGDPVAANPPTTCKPVQSGCPGH